MGKKSQLHFNSICTSIYVSIYLSIYLSIYMGFPGDTVVKNLPANVGDTRDMGLIPGSGRFPGGENGNPLQCSCLENPMDRGAWWTTYNPLGCRESDMTE